MKRKKFCGYLREPSLGKEGACFLQDPGMVGVRCQQAPDVWSALPEAAWKTLAELGFVQGQKAWPEVGQSYIQGASLSKRPLGSVQPQKTCPAVTDHWLLSRGACWGPKAGQRAKDTGLGACFLSQCTLKPERTRHGAHGFNPSSKKEEGRFL